VHNQKEFNPAKSQKIRHFVSLRRFGKLVQNDIIIGNKWNEAARFSSIFFQKNSAKRATSFHIST
jgi:hypothetical protein